MDNSRKMWYDHIVRGIGEVGIALEWHSRGQGFESPMLHCTMGAVENRMFLTALF